MPVRAARSETGLRPGYFLRRVRFGSKGWMIAHNESSINRFAMPSLLQNWSKEYNSFCYTLLIEGLEFWMTPVNPVERFGLGGAHLARSLLLQFPSRFGILGG